MLDRGLAISTVDVLRVPFAFSQAHLMTAPAFIRAAQDRGVRLDRQRLELLHRRRLLVPFLRRHARPLSSRVTELPQPQSLTGTAMMLWHAAAEGRLSDPARQPFRPWPKDPGGGGIFYSTYQLLALHALAWTLTALTLRKEGDDIVWELAPAQPELLTQASRERNLAIVLEVLAPRYRPRVMRVIHDTSDDLQRHIDDRNPEAEEKLLNLEPQQLVDQAEALLTSASFFDPLGKWHRVTRVGSASKWKDLRFDALLAMEQRIAAEHLLDFHQDLVDQGRAAALPELNQRWHEARHDRLRVGPRERAEALMDFRLTDRAAVVLALEGETEMDVAGRVLDLYGLGGQSDLVQLFNLRGVDNDVRLLARAVAVPRLDPQGYRGARLLSPLTGLVVAVDPEKKYKTAHQRDQQRAGMVEAVLDALPAALRTPAMRRDLEHVIHVRTWGTHSFEFAHFTDRELAGTLRQLAGRGAPAIAAIEAQIAACRHRHGNIEKMWKPWARTTKPALAAALWSTLERRMTAIPRRRTVPIADVVEEAIRLALRLRPIREVAVRGDEH